MNLSNTNWGAAHNCDGEEWEEQNVSLLGFFFFFFTVTVVYVHNIANVFMPTSDAYVVMIWITVNGKIEHGRFMYVYFSRYFLLVLSLFNSNNFIQF